MSYDFENVLMEELKKNSYVKFLDRTVSIPVPVSIQAPAFRLPVLETPSQSSPPCNLNLPPLRLANSSFLIIKKILSTCWILNIFVGIALLTGRPEKLPDVCYSWWVLASLKIIGRIHWIDKKKLEMFILACQDDETGGFADRPGDMVRFLSCKLLLSV